MDAQYEPVIGLEVHAQLLTRSKMFCRCGTTYAGAAANTHICPVCAGFPGVLPVTNQHAVELATRVGLALDCQIAETSRFDRKHYPYPDLPKGYQVSQYDLPLASGGKVSVGDGDNARSIGIVRVHMEEDTGRLLHRTAADGTVYSLADLNRSGVPLLEIVSEPEIRTAAEAREYVMKLRQILRYIGASSGNMEEGALRCDANVSVRPVGQAEFGAKVEIKNLNSFRMIERAIEHEISRQTQALGVGETIEQETRGWDEAAGVTIAQRTKEYASDYRYFPEPDLPPLTIAAETRQAVLERLPELPDVRRARFVSQYGVSLEDSSVLTTARETADFFEAVVMNLKGRAPAGLAAGWVTGELFRLLNRDSVSITDSRVTPELLAELVEIVHSGEINRGSGRTVLEELYATGGSPRAIATDRGLTQITDTDALAPVVRTVLANNPRAVGEFHGGKQQVVGFLLGQVMKETRGTADSATVRALLLRELTDIPVEGPVSE
ncbi:MAG: Asp-tRNA(Asn)/Glu-tRNA(Gln) amidotransferase subunit GatB [Chloroflexota bacterium]|nr:Asp-tRNA(Asn)/Glu-tRNA(Gln) amidotransferase subunit GatB [Chloroflexota bacterium]